MAVRSNQYGPSRNREGLVNNIEICGLEKNDPETPRLAASSRNNLDQIIVEKR